MPFKSRAQAGMFFAHPDKLGGLRNVREWARKTDFSHLPEHVGKLPPPKRRKAQ